VKLEIDLFGELLVVVGGERIVGEDSVKKSSVERTL